MELIQTSRVGKAAYGVASRHFYSGQINHLGQLYSVRNCSFEPATSGGGSSVAELMAQVDKSFARGKVAVFSTHRINYVGGIDEANRTRTLKILNEFLTALLQKYPDTMFLSSDRLIDILK